MNRAAKQKGFTLIELVLAMSFISVLLLAIALTVIQIGNLYNRGMTLKEVNQLGRSISDELTRTVNASESFSLASADRRYLPQAWGGRLCMGQFSYIWNYSKSLQSGTNDVATYTTGSEPIRLIKVPDVGASYCSGAPAFQKINPVGAVELLKVGDRTLALHELTVSSAARARDAATNQQLYNVSFTIGTSNLDALTADQTTCKPPSQAGSDVAYCSVQQFKLVLRAGNKVN